MKPRVLIDIYAGLPDPLDLRSKLTATKFHGFSVLPPEKHLPELPVKPSIVETLTQPGPAGGFFVD